MKRYLCWAWAFAAITLACGSNGGDPTSDASSDGDALDASSDVTSNPDADVCVPTKLPATKRELVMEVVLDGTGSMQSNQNWTSCSMGVQTFIQEKVTTTDPTFEAGLLAFSDSDDPSNGAGPYPTAVDVAPEIVDATQAQKIATRLAGGSPSGTSAIGPALNGAYTLVEGLASGARKVVVLVTDGPPEVTGSLLLSAASTALASSQGPVNTLVVAVGNGIDQSFMGDLAVAGGTRLAPSCDPHATGATNLCYVQLPNTPSQMTTALHDTLVSATHLTDCEWVVSGGATLSTNLVVSWSSGGGNPQSVAANATDGWTRDGAIFTFHGQSCTAIAGASSVSVEVDTLCN